jgi:hypothetical protein
MRIASATTAIAKSCDHFWLDKPDGYQPTPDDDALLEARHRAISERFEIPSEVHIFNLDESEPLAVESWKHAKRHITAFVKGTLSDEDWFHLQYFFEEVEECDYGWLLAEKSLYFYDAPGCPEDFDRDLAISELKAIGTRNKSKAKRLPAIFTIGGLVPTIRP